MSKVSAYIKRLNPLSDPLSLSGLDTVQIEYESHPEFEFDLNSLLSCDQKGDSFLHDVSTDFFFSNESDSNAISLAALAENHSQSNNFQTLKPGDDSDLYSLVTLSDLVNCLTVEKESSDSKKINYAAENRNESLNSISLAALAENHFLTNTPTSKQTVDSELDSSGFFKSLNAENPNYTSENSDSFVDACQISLADLSANGETDSDKHQFPEIDLSFCIKNEPLLLNLSITNIPRTLSETEIDLPEKLKSTSLDTNENSFLRNNLFDSPPESRKNKCKPSLLAKSIACKQKIDSVKKQKVLQIQKSLFQNLFPTHNVPIVKTKDIAFDKSDESVFLHYIGRYTYGKVAVECEIL